MARVQASFERLCANCKRGEVSLERFHANCERRRSLLRETFLELREGAKSLERDFLCETSSSTPLSSGSKCLARGREVSRTTLHANRSKEKAARERLEVSRTRESADGERLCADREREEAAPSAGDARPSALPAWAEARVRAGWRFQPPTRTDAMIRSKSASSGKAGSSLVDRKRVSAKRGVNTR